MNTRLRPPSRTLAPPGWAERQSRFAQWGTAPAARPAAEPASATRQPAYAAPTRAGRHPLADDAISAALRAREAEITAAFEAIVPALWELAPVQHEPDFVARAANLLRARLGIDVPQAIQRTDWINNLDGRALYAECVTGTFCRLMTRGFDRGLAALSDGESVETLIRRFGFHAIDITPCADGRLAGIVDYILRVPPAVVAYRRSYAGAMFDIDEAIGNWEATELSRYRRQVPNAPDMPTKFLKIGVYHFSSVDPAHGGCAAHGSSETRAAEALLTRLEEFVAAIRAVHGAEAAILLIGVDTDTDAIRVHIPDASGRMSAARSLSSAQLYDATLNLPREAGKEAIRAEVARAAGVSPDDPSTTGMRWLCGYLLKNNFGQLESVRVHHGGAYPDAGHTERLIVVGDPVDDVQLRNLVFQAQMRTLEEGAADLDIGVKVLSEHHFKAGLPVPVLVHFRHDPRIKGAAATATTRAIRLAEAIRARHKGLSSRGLLQVNAVIRGEDTAPHIVQLPPNLEYAP